MVIRLRPLIGMCVHSLAFVAESEDHPSVMVPHDRGGASLLA
jgi:hypothetical protein